MSFQKQLSLAFVSFTAGFYSHSLLDKRRHKELFDAKDAILKADAARKAVLEHPERLPSAIKSATTTLLEDP